METKTKEIAANKEGSPAELIQMAISQGTDLDQLEKLLDLQERWEKGEAKKAYHVAMTKFKENPPKIDKDKKVKYLNVKYSHASLANIVEKVTAELSKHGLSASWRTNQNGQIVVICRITHVLGHSEETSLSANSDDSGSKNSIQAMGSTINYLERYTLLAILGLSTYDQDDDGQSSEENEKIDENKIKILRDLLEKTKTDENIFLTYLEVDKLEDLLKSGFSKAKIALEAKK